MLTATAASLIVGLHLHTAHANKEMHDSTAGIYAIWPVGVAGGRLTTGLYQNSIADLRGRRWTVYAGQSWQSGRWGVMAGLGTGYRLKCERYSYPWRDGIATEQHCAGLGGSHVFPIFAPSVSFPEVQRYIGATPRLSLVGFKRPAIHLSIERSF